MADTMESDFIDDTSEPSNLSIYLPPFLAVVSVLGIFTNGALLFVLAKTKEQNVTNASILNLAVVDLLFSLFYLPVVASADAKRSYPYGDFVCKTTASSYMVAIGVSAFTLIALSAHSVRIESNTPARGGAVRFAAIWILAIIFAVPTILIVRVNNFDDGDVLVAYCEPIDHKLLKLEVSVSFAVHIVIPLAAIAYFHCIARQNRAAVTQIQSQGDFLNAIRVLVVVYAVCFVPMCLIDVLLAFEVSAFNDFWDALYVSTFCLNVVYRCINPVALYCSSGDFRQLFNRHLFWWFTPGSREAVDDNELPLRPLVEDSSTG